jgi:hypothetical protein
MLDVVKLEPQKHFIDYSHETKLSRNPALRYLWLILGLFFTGLGFLGYVLPGLPGTVFILLAVYCFARSSPRFYNWLLNHRVFGSIIRDWRAGLGLPMRVKVLAVSLIVLTIGSSTLIIQNLHFRIILLLCGISVSAYLLSRKTKQV